MKTRYITATLLIAAAVTFTACGGKNEPATDKKETPADSSRKQSETVVELTKEQYNTVGITTSQVTKRPLSGVLKVNGFLDVPPQNLVSVTVQIGGIVQSTPLLQGSFTRKGEVIAVLQNQDYVQLQQDYLDMKSQLEFSDAEYKRQQELSKENVNAQKILQQAKSQYYSLLARLSGIKEKLLLLKIDPDKLTASTITGSVKVYAPVDGYVTKVNVNVGKFVNSNDVMFEIVNGSNLHVELNVFEKDISKIKAGQKVRFKLANETQERLATISLIGKEINPDKTVRVHAIAKDGTSSSFIPGTYLSANVETVSSEVFTLPSESIVDFEGKKYVFVSKGTHTEQENAAAANSKDPGAPQEKYVFEMVEVNVGITDSGFTEVQLPATLDASKTSIVTKGTYDLLSKLKNSEEEE